MIRALPFCVLLQSPVHGGAARARLCDSTNFLS
jgi:hypothetical protein